MGSIWAVDIRVAQRLWWPSRKVASTKVISAMLLKLLQENILDPLNP
jgi:hypothetical protein